MTKLKNNNKFILNGYLELIIGPMFAGKTTRLIQIANKYKTLNQSILIIKPDIDNRYNTHLNIISHDKISEPCVSIDQLSKIDNSILDLYNVILIEEAQFFSDIYKYAIEWSENKRVYVVGLNGDSNKNLFGDLYKLIPHVDNIVFLKALCKECNDGTEAIFSKSNSNNSNIINVGGDELYSAVCRKHFQFKN